jgi:hypothetical protein
LARALIMIERCAAPRRHAFRGPSKTATPPVEYSNASEHQD